MAFNTGKYWLANGSSVWIIQWFGREGGGTDGGALWLMASPLPFDTFPTPSGTTQLETSRFQRRFVYANGGTDWTYNYFVENNLSQGWHSTWFTMSGGGNT